MRVTHCIITTIGNLEQTTSLKQNEKLTDLWNRILMECNVDFSFGLSENSNCDNVKLYDGG